MEYKCKDCGFSTDIEMRYLFHRRYGCYSFHESIAQSTENDVILGNVNMTLMYLDKFNGFKEYYIRKQEQANNVSRETIEGK